MEMMRMLPLLLVLGCTPKSAVAPVAAPSCTEAELDVLAALFESAALGVIAQGKCDDYIGGDVSLCPSYQAIESSFKLSAAAMCRTPK